MTPEKATSSPPTENPAMTGGDGAIHRLSAIICTFNRAQSLRLTLGHLLRCHFPQACEVEAIVVDNNSTDDTRTVVSTCAENSPIPIKYVIEPRPGVGHALNAGIENANGDVLCFLDDDSIPDNDFFVSVKQEFDSRNYLGVVGGRVELWNKADLPLTIKTDRVEQRLTPDRNPVGFLHGCNMLVHRRVFRTIGGFDRRLGPGSRVGSASDLDFYYRALRHGFEVVYCPQILVYHNHGRRTPAEAKALMTRYQIGRGAFYAKHVLAGDTRAWRYTYWDYYNCLRGLIASPFSVEKARVELGVLTNYCRGAFRFVRSRHSSGRRPEALNEWS